MPARETHSYEVNEVTWWGKWVDETVWLSKNCYVLFSRDFADEFFFNRAGFLGEERVPEDAIKAFEKEFERRKHGRPVVMAEEGRGWDKLRRLLSVRGYAPTDTMLVMESLPKAKGKLGVNPKVDVKIIVSGSKGGELREWTRTYLDAFYGDQKLNSVVEKVMRGALKDKKASVVLASIGRDPVGCAALYRSAGGVIGAYCIGTAHGFREMGVAATMVDFMRKLAEKEKRRLVLQTMASDSLEGFYIKQGFVRAYAKTLFEKSPREEKWPENDIPSGETFGVMMRRGAPAGTTRPFGEVFSGFERVEAVRELFGEETEEVIAKLKIILDSPRGYLRVDGETGNVIINPEYLKTGHERHLYLDVIHELTHVRQFKEGKELYDRKYPYFERPTEVEAYETAVREARRIGMDRDEIVEYLRVEWVTEEEFLHFVSKMKLSE